MGKGGGKAGKAHDYYGTIAGIVCAGPVDELVAIIGDGKLIWPWAADWSAGSYGVNALTRHSGRIWIATGAAGAGDEPGVAAVWAIYTVKRSASPNPFPIDVSADGVNYGRAYFYWGTDDQELDAVGEQTLSLEGHPPYRNQAFIVFKDFLFGRERTTAPNVEVVVRRKPKQTVIVGDAADLDADGQVSPLAALADAITDPVFGVGQVAGLMDATSWQSIADDLLDNAANSFISPLLDRAQTFRSFAAALLQYYDGWLRASGLGTIEAGRFLHNEAPPAFTDATTIDFHDAVEEIGFDANGWQDTYNDVLCRFTDPLRAFNQNATRASNLYNRQVSGEPRTQTLDRPWIHRAAQALRYAHEWGFLYGFRFLAGTIQVRAEKAASIRQGGLFKLTHDALALSAVCRCTQKVFAAPPSGFITLSFQSERSIGLLPYQPTPQSSPATGLPVLAAIDLYQFVQLPTGLADGKDFRFAVLAARPNGTIIGLRTWLKADDAANFSAVGQQRQWNMSGTLDQDYPAPGSVATSTRARASNVATIVTAAAHGLSTGMHVRIGGLADPDYDVDDVEITVTSATAFTYPNVGANESTTADTDGLVDPLADDNSETLQIAVDAGVIATDIDKFVQPTITEDDVADGHLLLFLLLDSDPQTFEVLSVRSIRLSGGNYLVKCRRGRFGTSRVAFTAGDRAWFIYRTDIVPLSHDKFAALATSGGTGTFRLQPFNSLVEADLSDAALCPDLSWTFADPNAPTASWQRLQQGGADISDFTTTFLTTDEFLFTMEFLDASGDLAEAKLIGRLGSTAKTLWSESLPASGRQVKSARFILDTEGDWQIIIAVKDASGRLTEQELTPVGGGASVTLKIRVSGSSACAMPVATPGSGAYPSFPRSVTLSCSTPGSTILYQIVALYAAPGGSWSTYAGAISVGSGKTVHAKAQAAGLSDSAVASFDYWYEPYEGGSGGRGYQLP